jgi:hypothetical protein
MTAPPLAEADRDILTAWVAGDPAHRIANDQRLPVSKVRARLQGLCGFDENRARQLLGMPPKPVPPPAAHIPAPAAERRKPTAPSCNASGPRGTGPLVDPIHTPKPSGCWYRHGPGEHCGGCPTDTPRAEPTRPVPPSRPPAGPRATRSSPAPPTEPITKPPAADVPAKVADVQPGVEVTIRFPCEACGHLNAYGITYGVATTGGAR